MNKKRILILLSTIKPIFTNLTKNKYYEFFVELTVPIAVLHKSTDFNHVQRKLNRSLYSAISQEPTGQLRRSVLCNRQVLTQDNT